MKKVVVVDDNRIDRLIVKNALETNNIEAVTVGDPESAIQIVETVLPDAIVLDLNLQDGFRGIDLLKEFKLNDKIKSIPVIFVSSSECEKDEKEAFVFGCVDYVHKPIDITSLVESVKKHALLNEIAVLWSKVKEQARKMQK